MDNMLYIIAGLVVILLIVVLVMRKNKAQKPSEQPGIQSGNNNSLSTKAGSKSTPTQTATNNEKKFDHIDIAQRFMDQQRYDKALETLNRGLIEKPNDSQMSLKLLAVYATIDESDSFNKVYDAIKANNDEQSIAQADELKALLTAEQEQVAKQALPADNSQSTEFESLDFDLPTNKAVHNSPVVDTAAEKALYQNDLLDSTYQPNAASDTFDNSQRDSNNFEDIEQAFDLSLSDLEDSANKSAYMADVSSAPVTKLDLADNNILAASVIENDIVIDSNNIDADFDFDWSEKSPVSSESSVDVASTQDSVNNQSNELTLDDEFVLDLDDSHIDTDSTINNEVNSADIAYDSLSLSLDNNDVSDETSNQTEIQQSSAVDNFDDFSFENISIENANIKDLSIEETGIIKNKSEAPSIAPTTLMFDDNTVIDDDFDFDNISESATTSMPVASEQSDSIDNAIDIAPVADLNSTGDFSAQFAADFDFVKTLDSNQVTLDLAGQYLQLGEYDSAKRLLNEVIAQGNSEQQQQAQQLLGAHPRFCVTAT